MYLYPLFILPVIFLFKLLLSSFGIHNFHVDAVSWQDASSLAKWHHPSRRVTDDDVSKIVNAVNRHHEDFNITLDNIMIPRVPGTENHSRVRKYIIHSLKSLKWIVEEDKFTNTTPHGNKPFSNIIATLNPKGCRQLVLACHYDSLQNREGTFVGATDSAVPCTMLIHLAKLLDVELKKHSRKSEALTLQFIFFDGEEAFRHWSKTDSLYGSRHLAERWNKIPFPQENEAHCKSYGDFVSTIDRIDALVLLDLLGSPNPSFYSYFMDTHSLYKELVNTEKRLNSLKHLEVPPPQQATNYFNENTILTYIEDDHIPFMKKGVPIIHMIPYPFPAVWHRESDNKRNLHHPTINNLNKILFVFIAEYLHLYTPEPTAM